MRYKTVRAGWRAVLCIREGLCQGDRDFIYCKQLPRGLIRLRRLECRDQSGAGSDGHRTRVVRVGEAGKPTVRYC